MVNQGVWMDNDGVLHITGGWAGVSPRSFVLIDPAVTALTEEEVAERDRVMQELGGSPQKEIKNDE